MHFLFVFEFPVVLRDLDRFGIDLLRSLGHLVDVWDVTPLIAPASAGPSVEGVRVFASRSEVRTALKTLAPQTIMMSDVGYSPRSIWFYRCLSGLGVYYGMCTASVPPRLRDTSVRARLRRHRGFGPKRALASIAQRVPPRLYGISPPRYLVCGGSESTRSCLLLAPSTIRIWAHSADYDVFNRALGMPKLMGGRRFAVFLDEYLPFHPDFAHSGLAPYAKAEEYYPAMRALFDRVEREAGLPVVIAAHPRAEYGSAQDWFGGREVFRGESARLVNESALVITHASTAVSFAVLARKPVLFATTEGLEASESFAPAIASTAAWLGKQPIDGAGCLPIDWERELAVDEELYAAYVGLFIKRRDSPAAPAWQIVAETLDRLFRSRAA